MKIQTILSFDEFVNYDHSNLGMISETSLARLVDKTRNQDFAILTGFRANYSHKQNLKRNRELLYTLNKSHMGPYVLIGHW